MKTNDNENWTFSDRFLSVRSSLTVLEWRRKPHLSFASSSIPFDIPLSRDIPRHFCGLFMGRPRTPFAISARVILRRPEFPFQCYFNASVSSFWASLSIKSLRRREICLVEHWNLLAACLKSSYIGLQSIVFWRKTGVIFDLLLQSGTQECSLKSFQRDSVTLQLIR